MKFLKASIFATAMLASSLSVAHSQTSYTMDLTLVNSSDSAITYTGEKGENPGNVFTVTPDVIPPQGTAEVTGVITQDFDLSATLTFTDDMGGTANLVVLDPRQFHNVQPIFEMSLDDKYVAAVVSRVRNPHIAPRDLFLTSVVVNIENKALYKQ
jgi:hypothetical protein